MRTLPFFLIVAFLSGWIPTFAWAVAVVEEVLEPPATPGNAYTGTFIVTPTTPTWAFGVGNDQIQDVSISGIASIEGQEANDLWFSTLIHRDSWDNGYDFSANGRPIGTTPPSAFTMDTSSSNWQWGNAEYVAFYFLYGAGSPLATLKTGQTYDFFKFFTSGPESTYALYSDPDGNAASSVTVGDVVVTVIPLPAALPLLTSGIIGLAGLAYTRRKA